MVGKQRLVERGSLVEMRRKNVRTRMNAGIRIKMSRRMRVIVVKAYVGSGGVKGSEEILGKEWFALVNVVCVVMMMMVMMGMQG